MVLMTFFPMLVATLAGLQAAGKLERELMHSYAASYTRTLLDLRLPCAVPFIFSALKVNATLALIGAIVAEFFGSPTVGLGFRISTEASRMNMALVWGAIVVAAVTGSVAYALLVQLERRAGVLAPFGAGTADVRRSFVWSPFSNHPQELSDDRLPRSQSSRWPRCWRCGLRQCRRQRRRQGHGADEVGAAGPVCRLLRGRSQGLLQGRGPGRHHQAGRPRRVARCRCWPATRPTPSSTGCPTRWPRAKPACRWSTSRRSSTSSGLMLTCKKASGVASPKDFKGKTLGVWFGGNEYPFLNWMAKLGLKPDTDIKVLKQGFNVDPLLQNQAACISTMIYNEYWQVVDAGVKESDLVTFFYEKEGVASLEDGLYVLEAKLKDPAFVARMGKFLQGHAQGLERRGEGPGRRRQDRGGGRPFGQRHAEGAEAPDGERGQADHQRRHRQDGLPGAGRLRAHGQGAAGRRQLAGDQEGPGQGRLHPRGVGGGVQAVIKFI